MFSCCSNEPTVGLTRLWLLKDLSNADTEGLPRSRKSSGFSGTHSTWGKGGQDKCPTPTCI